MVRGERVVGELALAELEGEGLMLVAVVCCCSEGDCRDMAVLWRGILYVGAAVLGLFGVNID